MLDVPELLTAKEVARLLRVSPRTVHVYRRAGKINAIRLGERGPVRFYRDSVARLCGASPTRTRAAEDQTASDLVQLAALGLAPPVTRGGV